MIDLHIHTNYSDGEMSPEDIIKFCQKNHFTTISITDHDAIGGIKRALLADDRSIRIIPGIELGTGDSDPWHVLGYWIDLDNETLNQALDEIRNTKTKELMRVVRALKTVGIDIRKEVMIQKRIDIATIADIIAKRGYAADKKSATDQYLSRGRPAYVERSILPPKQKSSSFRPPRG